MPAQPPENESPLAETEIVPLLDPQQDLVLPEVEVVGRLDSFPANPLPDTAAITPTGTTVAVGKTGSSVTVITGEEIQRTQQTTVAEVLRQVEGLNVVRNGGPGGITSVFIRGANSQHTKVILDGIPINDPSNAGRSFDFSTLSTQNIERIEVLRGPQSMLYGSDAIGGVINIITKRGEGPLTATALVEGGSFNSSNTSLTMSGGNDLFYHSTSLGYQGTDGVSSAQFANGNPERDGYYNGTISGRYGWTPSELLNVDYVFRYADVHAAVDDQPFGSLPVDNLIRSNLSDVFYEKIQLQSFQFDGLVEHRVAFDHTNYKRVDTDPGFLDPQYNGATKQFEYQMNLMLLEDNIFTVGTNHLNEEASNTSTPAVSQYLSGVFLQDQYQLGDRFYGTAGVRWDDHSVAGTAQTYRFTFLIDAWEIGSEFHGSIGTGFRAPSLAENLFPFGNPNLRPERSKGWDVGMTKYIFDRQGSVDVTYFRNDFQDLIAFDFNTFMLENIGTARSTGVEVVGVWGWNERTDIRSTYTFTSARDLDNDRPLQRRPKNKATLGVERQVASDATVNLYLLYVDSRFDLSGPLDSYITVNVAGAYDLAQDITLVGRIDNLFDEDYEEVPGFGTLGIGAYSGLRFVW
ncbi:TonB-dependent receptor [Blastopirellula sp. J2-11]|uniref:TonB-dependent receptor plug domain-containing protein n=1 Tax=Blastopirellula sp. J2-11 TaxID=2943192 RepID=UPI0021C85C92|nr:TonB-dependent receptor [Blastopirellula sp. J2-11]UUO05553.1 TonB-dependent receptor [Blastopirellula sp. J2-11]